MPNAATKINERLNLIEDMEMMPNEISKRLEQELMKPENEIDVQLVEELLERLNAAEPTPEEAEECWAAIQSEMKHDKAIRRIRVARRCATIAAALVLACLITVGTARAFRWSFLMKLLAPLAETFGIYTTSNLESDISNQAPVEGVAAYTFTDTEYLQLSYDSSDEMPETENGFRIVPKWTPERFAFVQGSIYEDPDVFQSSVTYVSGKDILSMNAKYYFDDGDVGGYIFEKEASEASDHNIRGHEVTIYNVTSERRMAAVWIVGDMHYLLHGNLSEDEMKNVIESVLE